jgi:WD40 repeat protein
VVFEDGSVDVVDRSGRRLRHRAPPDEALDGSLVSADGSTVAIATTAGIEILDSDDLGVRAVGPASLVRPLAASPDGSILIAGTAIDPDDLQHRVAIIDTTSGAQLFNFGGLIQGGAGAFLPTGDRAVVPVSEVRTTSPTLWLVEPKGDHPPRVVATDPCVRSVAFASDGSQAATVNCTGSVSLYDLDILASGEGHRALIGHRAEAVDQGVGISFGPDDATVVVTGGAGAVASFVTEPGLAQTWAFRVGTKATPPVVEDGTIWVGWASVGIDGVNHGVIGMPAETDLLVDLARSAVTRPPNADECSSFPLLGC